MDSGYIQPQETVSQVCFYFIIFLIFIIIIAVSEFYSLVRYRISYVIVPGLVGLGKVFILCHSCIETLPVYFLGWPWLYQIQKIHDPNSNNETHMVTPDHGYEGWFFWLRVAVRGLQFSKIWFVESNLFVGRTYDKMAIPRNTCRSRVPSHG